MLTIGDFSRLSRVTPRMLRHYDALGLLHPEEVGENGYRYYRQEQLSDLIRILWLKDLGFSLEEIGRIAALEDRQLLPLLRQKREALALELEARQDQLRRLEADILRMEGTKLIEKQYHVDLIQDPEQKVFSIRETIGVEQYHDFFQRLYREAETRGLTQAGPIQMLYHDKEFSRERSDVEAQMVVAQDGPDVKVKPACLCAAVQHRGPYENLQYAYDALCAWLGEHTGYQICGPAMDRYFGDPDNTPPDQLETGVLFPVKKIG